MSDVVQSYRMDKSQLTVARLDDESDEKEYWSRQTPHERLRALEFLRSVTYGYDPATARLQRLLTVTRLGES